MDCTDILYVPKLIVPILTFNVPKLDVPKKTCTESVCTEIVLYRKRPSPYKVVSPSLCSLPTTRTEQIPGSHRTRTEPNPKNDASRPSLLWLENGNGLNQSVKYSPTETKDGGGEVGTC